MLDLWSFWAAIIVDHHSFTVLEQSPQRDTGLKDEAFFHDTVTSVVGEFKGEVRRHEGSTASVTGSMICLNMGGSNITENTVIHK